MRDHREAAKMIDILEHFSGVVSETERRLWNAYAQHMAGTSGDLCADDDEDAIRVPLLWLEVEIVVVGDDDEIEPRLLCCRHDLINVADAVRVHAVYVHHA